MATTADEVWALLGELIESQKETERLFQASKLEAEQRMQETERLLKESKEEADRRMKETDRQIRAVNKELGELGDRLGGFVEWQVRPAAVRLFRERGIAVREISRDVSVDNGDEAIDVDVLVVDTTQAVAIEVKSKLTQRDVDEHLERLGKFKRAYCPVMPIVKDYLCSPNPEKICSFSMIPSFNLRFGKLAVRLFEFAQFGLDLNPSIDKHNESDALSNSQ